MIACVSTNILLKKENFQTISTTFQAKLGDTFVNKLILNNIKKTIADKDKIT